MKTTLIAALLGFGAFQILSWFDPLRTMLSVFLPWQRIAVVGAWCALLSVVGVLGGRMAAARYRWRPEFFILLFGIAFACVHFPSGRYGPRLIIPHEYLVGIVEMAAIWTSSALIAHWITSRNSPEARRE